MFNEPDLFKCQQIPFFCDGTAYPQLVWNVLLDDNGYPLNASMQESSSFMTSPSWPPNTDYAYTPSCCACQSHWMPEYFYNDKTNLGYEDDKHGFIQLVFEALEQIELTVALELLNGNNILDFELNVIDIGDVFVHSPSRAEYTPSVQTRAAFLAIITSGLYGALSLPLNLPFEVYNLPGYPAGGSVGTFASRFEYKVLLGRTSDLYQGDPGYEDRYAAHEKVLYQIYLNGLNFSGNSTQNVTSFADFAEVPNLKEISAELYSIPDPLSIVSFSLNPFWNLPEVSQGFLGMPYFPYFSNCKGSGSFISIAKLTETDPSCPLVNYDRTVPVSPYPWYRA